MTKRLSECTTDLDRRIPCEGCLGGGGGGIGGGNNPHAVYSHDEDGMFFAISTDSVQPHWTLGPNVIDPGTETPGVAE